MIVAVIVSMFLVGAFVAIALSFLKEVVFDPSSKQNKLKKEKLLLQMENNRLKAEQEELTRKLKLTQDELTVYSFVMPQEKEIDGPQE
jgi:Tfp pilus assembly protein PilN